MDFLSESEFEKYIRQEVISTALPNNLYALFNFKKAVDILVAYNGANAKVFFIEIKYHKLHHGRLGFGGSKGSGFQPEVLNLRPKYFESNLRWILGKEGSTEFWFLTNEQLGKYIAGGLIGEKHNNIQNRLFTEIPSITQEQLIAAVTKWLEDV